jgi:hypothetical protein
MTPCTLIFLLPPPVRLRSPAGRSLCATLTNQPKGASSPSGSSLSERAIAIRYFDTPVLLVKTDRIDLVVTSRALLQSA